MPPEPKLANGMEINDLLTQRQLAHLNDIQTKTWKRHSLLKCEFCERTFFYEKLLKHQKGCNGMKKSQKKKKTDRESEKPSAFFHEKHDYAKPEVARKKSQKKKKTDREWEKPSAFKPDPAKVNAGRTVPVAWDITAEGPERRRRLLCAQNNVDVGLAGAVQEPHGPKDQLGDRSATAGV